MGRETGINRSLIRKKKKKKRNGKGKREKRITRNLCSKPRGEELIIKTKHSALIAVTSINSATMYGSSVCWNWLIICIQEHYARCHLHSTEITPNFYRNKEPCSAKNIIINSLWFTWRTRFTSHESRKRINIFITRGGREMETKKMQKGGEKMAKFSSVCDIENLGYNW